MSALSAVYGRVARLRRSWYERHPDAPRRLARPVISVGNLVVGGSGKTPVVAALARTLLAMGQRPAVLSRGYARRGDTDGVVIVSDGDRVLVPVEASGDEPQMLARALPGVPVLVASDRYLAGRLAERRFGATAMLLDDGFQHLALARTIDLLLVDPQDLDERVLPSGRLREPLSAARSADAVLVHGSAAEAERVAGALGVGTAFTVRRCYGVLRAIRPAGGPPGVRRNGTRVLAAAGIARPERFFAALRDRGFTVAREVAFRDHHWYTPRDVARISALAIEVQADVVVTTEKDEVRLAPVLGSAVPGGTGGPDEALPPGRVEWAVLPMDVVVEPAPEWARWLAARL